MNLLRKIGTGALIAGMVGTGLFGLIVVLLGTAFLFSLPTGWLFMIAIGIVHSSAHAVPALGFWASAAIMFVLRLIFGNHSHTTSK